MSSRLARCWNSVIALLVAAGLVVQLWIAVRVSATQSGHAVGTLAGTAMGNRVVRVLSFFTIQSNILSGVTAVQPARNPNRAGPVWRAWLRRVGRLCAGLRGRHEVVPVPV